MGKYAVVRINGKQYKISEKEEILVDKIKDTKNLGYDVLLLVDGEKVKIGKPTLKEVKIKFSVVKEEEKGKKIKVFKYKAKSRYRKTKGFRPSYTRLLVEKIA